MKTSTNPNLRPTIKVNLNKHSNTNDMINSYLASNKVTVCKTYTPASKNRPRTCGSKLDRHSINYAKAAK